MCQYSKNLHEVRRENRSPRRSGSHSREFPLCWDLAEPIPNPSLTVPSKSLVKMDLRGVGPQQLRGILPLHPRFGIFKWHVSTL